VFTRLKGAVMSRLLEAEMTHHLGHEHSQPRRGSNARNGHSRKTVHTETGSVVINVPRDREGSFEPKIIPKHQRRLEGFDEKVSALYARGMTTRDISAHLRMLSDYWTKADG
jgi:transposase-like protein